MSEPLVLVVLLSTSSANADPTTEPMMVAIRRVLGPEATVVRDVSAASDSEALSIGERSHARAVARVGWVDGVARLHVHVAPSSPTEWSDQEIAFAPQDAMAERGRTVGYALAAMVERLERERERASESARAAPPNEAEPTAPTTSTTAVTEERHASRRTGIGDFDVFLQGVGTLGGGATAVGGALGIRWWPLPSFGVRLAGGARLGSIDEAKASTSTWFLGGGPAYRLVLGRFGVGARADVTVLRHVVEREQMTRTRWVGALDLILEADWALGAHVGVFFGAGPEIAFGATDVAIGGRRVANIPPLRGSAEVGLRIRF